MRGLAASLFTAVEECKNPISELFLESGGKIRPLDGLEFGRLGHNARHNAIALLEFDNFTGIKPLEELSAVAELAYVYAWHEYNVTQYVAHCQAITCPIHRLAPVSSAH